LFELTRVILYYFCVKIFSCKKLDLISLTIVFATSIYGQDFGTKQPIDSTDFYVFTEAGGQYIPSIQFNDLTETGTLPIVVPGVLEYSYTGTATYSDFIVQPSIGYNFILGFGYMINKNIGVEIEVGYSENNLGSASFSVSTSGSGSGTILGLPFNGTASGGGTGTISSSSATLTYIPILINFSVQEKSQAFQPTASVGFGVCPTILKANNLALNYVESGTVNVNVGGFTFPPVTYSGIQSGFGELEGQQTAFPFAFKLKAGFDYAFSPNTSLGLRAWAMGLVNSDFGDQMKSDLYGAIGLNASFKVRF
jgi:hypothetical protein